MRLTPLAVLLSLSPLSILYAQDSLMSAPPAGQWHFGVIRQAPDFKGSYEKTGASSWDTGRDLGLGKDTTGTGVLLDYEGSRFLLHMGTYSQDYAGDNKLTQNVTINNQTFSATARLQSQIKLRDYELDWTIKLWRWDAAYLGLDLGINDWQLDVSALGTTTSGPLVTQSATDSVSVPIPQIGLSAGGHFGSSVDVRGYYNLLSKGGANYHRAGVDLRYFPLSWLGLRANLENESFDVPRGSIGTDTTLHITKNGAGFGIIARF